MPPLFKTWLTLCLLLPLAAHATNREQRLPSGFTGYTSNATVKHAPVKQTTLRARPGSSAKAHNLPAVAAMSPKQSSDVLSRAVNVLGTPYVWGGSSPKKGFDCSGLVKYAFNDVADVDLPRTSNAMAQGHGVKVAKGDLKPGDLIFFNIKSRRVNHVAIYLGNDRFIHAPRRGKRVSIDNLSKPYWQQHYVVAKRVLPKDQQQLALAKR
ncbi:C40 family peptidase [Pseudomonas putida]|uniref:C40 family peptidase n=1 Tax=Pseudomonas putida TaxID=303 RepID=A0A7W2KWX7_PSEPU|nr:MULTISPECIES: C40 family peptidase [Pseudomonas]MBA6114347.1 C40 family peptidase [Pseudomonas putida]MBI6940403.1 C40 family peptidase [Pseudomonas putida]MBI6956601.1 C40 family peptidase [Pseudomonas putida]MCZ9640130.1 C40 family peptidase [Pseudomonas putida]MEC4878791.1 C40 family peptidase [Pseudomonas sp. NC26]